MTTVGTRPVAPTALSGWRVRVDRMYTWLAVLFVAALVVQVFLAGVGVFGDHASKVAHAASFDPHRALGTVLGLVAVGAFLLAVAARTDRRTVIGALVLALLTFLTQPVLAGSGDNNKWVGGLHALDGFLILGLAIWLAARSRRRVG